MALNKKNKKGFTLLELLVVIAIILLLGSTAGAGVIFLRNTVSLDEVSSNISSEFDAFISRARNSFVSGNAAASLSSTRISLGWVITIGSNADDTINMSSRSVYFNPTVNYDLNNLRQDIGYILTLKNFSCSGESLTADNSPVKIGTNFAVKCATTIGEEYVDLPDEFPGIIAIKDAQTPVANCISASNRINMFVSAGYAEMSVLSNGQRECQIILRNAGTLSSLRSLRINTVTSTMELCGGICSNVSTGKLNSSTIKFQK